MREGWRMIYRFCLIAVVAALAVTASYRWTDDVIARREQAAGDALLKEVLPLADRFEKVQPLGEAVLALYVAFAGDAPAGYVAEVTAQGYGGELRMRVGLDVLGQVVDIVVVEHSETPNLGTKVFEQSHIDKFAGRPAGEPVEAITGATRTSNALWQGVFAAGEAVAALEGSI